MQVPFLDLQTPHRELWQEIRDQFEEAFHQAAFIGGRHVKGFEEEFASFCSAGHCASVANGTDAVRLGLLALAIGPGDEVITTPHTFIATSEAISQTGARPVFVDIDPRTYLIDPQKVEAAITPRTRAIVPVHLYGQCADMDPLLALATKHHLKVLEDAAQAHGALYKGKPAGSMGDAAAFSFYPGKNLGACGEAGAVTSQDPEVIARVKMYREHGQKEKYFHEVEGYNARMDALQAIVLRAKLKKLSAWNEARNGCAAYYDKHLSGRPGIVTPFVTEGNRHIYHLYVVLVEQREKIQQQLQAKGISTGLHYPLPLHLQNAYRAFGHKPGDFPVSEHVAERVLSLPMFPTLTSEQQDYVCTTLTSLTAEE